MEKRNLYQPVELELLEMEQYVSRLRTNTFFEMVFVLDGEGIQVINGHRLPYALVLDIEEEQAYRDFEGFGKSSQ